MRRWPPGSLMAGTGSSSSPSSTYVTTVAIATWSCRATCPVVSHSGPWGTTAPSCSGRSIGVPSISKNSQKSRNRAILSCVPDKTTLQRLIRMRWGVRAVLVLGVATSVAANILHAQPNGTSRAIAAWPPLALLVTIELISKVPVHRRSLAAVRLLGAATIAGIVAWVSYWHMSGVAARYGESNGAPQVLPLSVDGLIVVASVSLMELASRIDATLAPVPVALPDAKIDRSATRGTATHLASPLVALPTTPGPAVPPTTPQRAMETNAKVNGSASATAPTRPALAETGSLEQVRLAHLKWPDATNPQLAELARMTPRTVARYRPVVRASLNGGSHTEGTS